MEVGRGHILTVFSELKIRTQNLKLQWEQGWKIMVLLCPRKTKAVAPGVHKEVEKC